MSDPWALVRYQAAGYIALVPKRGERRALLEQLAARSWIGPDGEAFTVSAETLRVWARRYRTGGLDALRDATPARPGIQALTEEEIALFCGLKREVSARSLDRLPQIAESMQLIEVGKARRRTVHRALRAEHLSARRPKAASNEDLDRFKAGFPNGGTAVPPFWSAQALATQAAAVASAKAVTVFTGADMNRLRTERGLSQQELAALMGVGHGMVGKAELVPTEALGERMLAAYVQVALPGGAPG
jgi:transposase